MAGAPVNESTDYADTTFVGLDELAFVNRLRQNPGERFVFVFGKGGGLA